MNMQPIRFVLAALLAAGCSDVLEGEPIDQGTDTTAGETGDQGPPDRPESDDGDGAGGDGGAGGTTGESDDETGSTEDDGTGAPPPGDDTDTDGSETDTDGEPDGEPPGEPADPPGPPCDEQQRCPAGYGCDLYRYTEGAWFCVPDEPETSPCFDSIQTTHDAGARGVCLNLDADRKGPNCADDRDDPDRIRSICENEDEGVWYEGTCLEWLENEAPDGMRWYGTSAGNCAEYWQTSRIHMFSAIGWDFAVATYPAGWWPNPTMCSENPGWC